MTKLMKMRNEEALQMLQDKGVQRFTDVQTADGVHLGGAIRIQYRPEDNVAPGLKLWAAYLEIFASDLGEHIYVPTDFVDEYDPAANKIVLTVDLKTVEGENWDHIPNFVAGKLGKVEELPYPEGYPAG